MPEQGTVDALRECGAGGRTVTIYAQAEIVKDLVALQLADEPTLLFEA